MRTEPIDNHLDCILEVVSEEGYVFVECTNHGVIVKHLHGDANPFAWELTLKIPNLSLEQEIDGISPKDVELSIRGVGQSGAEIVSIERQDGKEFVCMKCHSRKPASAGAADNHPFRCDDCWKPDACKHCGVEADAPDHKHEHDCINYRMLEEEITHRGATYTLKEPP